MKAQDRGSRTLTLERPCLYSARRLLVGTTPVTWPREPVLSEPKKGKDLSALKARLAKKAGAGEGPDDAPVPPEAAAAEAPGEFRAADVPPPGEVRPAMPDIPAPGEVRKPINIPAPGEVLRPEPAPMAPMAAPAPAKRQALSEDLFSGGSSFDPNAGVIDDVGEIKSRGGLGLPIFAGLIGAVVGLGLGWMGHKVLDSNARVGSAKAKAAEISERVKTIEEARAKLALKIGDAEEAIIAKDGAKMSEALLELNDEPVEISDMFGWQMATMDPEAVKAFLKLANGYNAMIFQAGFIKALVDMKKDALTAQIGGPTSYVVVRVPETNKVVLAASVSAICEALPEPAEGVEIDYDKLKRCAGDVAEATAIEVRTELGAGTAVIPADQVSLLVPNAIYTFAIGTNPDKVVVDDVMFRIATLKKLADDLKRNSEKAAEGAAALGDDPQVDG